MSRRTSVLLVASWLAVPGLAFAQEQALTPQKIAEIRRDDQAAKAKVNAAYGNRQPSEMSTEERSQATKDQQAAGLGVLEQHGVSDKDYSRQVARLSPEEREAVAQAEKKLEADAKAAQEAKKEAEKKQEEAAAEDIPIQQGISEANPVEMEASADSASVVEQGLPPGAEAGNEAATADSAAASEEAAPVAPAAAHSKKGSHKK